MALAHFWMQNLGRTTRTLPASTTVAYLQREAAWAAEAYLRRTSAQGKARDDLRHAEVRNLPPWAQDSAARFFAAAERYEGVNRYHAILVQFSLPREMTHAQHLALTEDFIAATMSDKPLLWVKHEPRDRHTGEPQPHIHILLSARAVDGIARDAWQTFRRWQPAHPAQGGCRKDLFWSRRQAPEQLRQAFADLTNLHAERLGLALRIDARSLHRRGIDRVPMHDEATRPSPAVLAQEALRAAEGWEQRKAYKQVGDVTQLSREAMIGMVRQWTRAIPPGTAVPRMSAEAHLTILALQEDRAAATEREAGLERRILHQQRQQLQRTGSLRPLPATRTQGYGLQADLHREEDHAYGYSQ